MFFPALCEPKGFREFDGLDESLNAEPERLRELATSEEPLEDVKALRKKWTEHRDTGGDNDNNLLDTNVEVRDCIAEK